jgi:hypothetical protein
MQAGAAFGPFGAIPGSNGAKRARGSIPGVYDPARDAPAARMSRDQVSFLSQWKEIDSSKIAQALLFYDTDRVVQDAVNMKLNHILGGGISFKRRAHRMNPAAARWHSRTYVDILRQIYRYGLSCGFAAQSYKPHAEYIGEPILLDLARVEIYVLTDLWGSSHFKFFQAQAMSAGASMADDDSNLEIEHVTIIPFNLPTAEGRIRSIADMLLPDYLTEIDLQDYTVMACKLKCFPPLVTELHEQKTNTSQQQLYSSYGVNPALGGADGDAAGASASANARLESDRAVKQALREFNSGAKPVDGIGSNGMHAAMYSNQVFIDKDRAVARVESAQEPNRYIEFSQKRRDDVFAFFSIPPGVVAPSGGSSQKSSASSMNSMTVFINDQKQLKNRFLGIVQDMNASIATNQYILDGVMEGLSKRQRRDAGDIKLEAEIEVEMPGIPEDKVVLDLYMIGALTYDMVCDTMAAKHGLSRARAFNAKPAIDVKLLNGVKPEPPSAPGSAPSAFR